MTGVASLGMYDGPGACDANDRLWRLIAVRLRERGIADVPETLDRQRPIDTIWNDPDLLLAQCCGYPLMTRFADRLRVVATPRYAVEGCEGASCRSRLIVRSDDASGTLADLRGRRAAINERGSNSGANLFRAAVAPLAVEERFFATVIETGSHRASVRTVAAGDADIAAIDPVSFAHLRRDEPALAGRVRTLGWTEASPALPFVTSIATPDDVVRTLYQTLRDVVASPDAKALMIDGIVAPVAYDPVIDIERRAVDLGYAELA